MENKKYTKRAFLRILGLGMVFMPLVSCFDNKGETSTKKRKDDPKDPKPKFTVGDEIAVTDEDVVLLTRNDSSYATYNEAFNKRVQHLPKYIAVCKTERGVQYAIQKARNEHLKVAIKSGGHSFEGFSSNDGGMVINLSQMKKITWLENDEVLVQPGCVLQDIQAELFPKKKLLPGGSCGTVGIAGLTLGGGYGFFSRKFGFTCDNLLQLRMVGADGKIYNTDDDKDLLWACKGGGNGHFGVVTSFKFKVHDIPPTFDAYVLKFRNMTSERFESTLNAYFDVSSTLPQEAFAAYVLNGKTLTVLITNYKNYPDFAQTFAPITALADTTTPSLNAALPKAMKRYYGRKGPLYFKNASAGLYKGKEDVLQGMETLFNKVVDNPGIVFQINTLGGAIANPEFESGSCYPHRHLPNLGELQAYWEQESQASRLTAAFEDIQNLFRDNGIKEHYGNYPDLNFKDWATMYYGDNYPKLQEIKRKYDPADLFHYEQSITIS